MATARMPTQRRDSGSDTPVRERILEAAFAAFMDNGYTETSTREIATRARVSKRELYSQVATSRHCSSPASLSARGNWRYPADLAVPRDRDTLEQVLASFGTQLVREISDPTVIGAFRLAIAEAVRAPEVARTLDSIGRETSRAALRGIMAQAQAAGLLDGRPAELAQQFGASSWAISSSASS